MKAPTTGLGSAEGLEPVFCINCNVSIGSKPAWIQEPAFERMEAPAAGLVGRRGLASVLYKLNIVPIGR